MAIDVLVVDDSGFFRRRLCEILNSDPRLNVIDTANHGREAVEKTLALKPGVITMDYEMPIMNGVAAVSEIMAKQPTPIIMFSSLTHEGARVTLDALEAGAVDFIPKNFEDISRDSAVMKKTLIDSVLAVAKTSQRVAKPSRPAPVSASVAQPIDRPKSAERKKIEPVRSAKKPAKKVNDVEVVIVGTSTGGPVALQAVMTQISASYNKPILIVQHMPAAFTGAFAERLNKICKIQVKLAEDGEKMQGGVAYVAPGGRQMMLDRRSGGIIKIIDGDERLNYKPSLDITFASAAKNYPAKTLGIVLTGMGSDGCDGARLLKQSGSTVWSQNESSCVIYGMPMAVANANLTDAVLDLSEIGQAIEKET